jgi:hypothetical protein
MHASPTLHPHHPLQDAILFVVAAALALTAVLALAVALQSAGGQVDLRWLSFRHALEPMFALVRGL